VTTTILVLWDISVVVCNESGRRKGKYGGVMKTKIMTRDGPGYVLSFIDVIL
jgi:hypothetical protein